jgi:hypothetical protein
MNMPRVFRVMRKELDGLPTLNQTSLGVRPGVDIDLDSQNNVLVNGKGMSVAPNWRDININRIPKRLRPKMPGAGGSNSTFCFRAGAGAFVQGVFANGLTLEPDSATHGNVAPAQVVPLPTYEADIAATRPEWQEDET